MFLSSKARDVFNISGSLANSSFIKSNISFDATPKPAVLYPKSGNCFWLISHERPAGLDNILAAIRYLTTDAALPRRKFNKLLTILPDTRPPADAATSDVTRCAALIPATSSSSFNTSGPNTALSFCLASFSSPPPKLNNALYNVGWGGVCPDANSFKIRSGSAERPDSNISWITRLLICSCSSGENLLIISVMSFGFAVLKKYLVNSAGFISVSSMAFLKKGLINLFLKSFSAVFSKASILRSLVTRGPCIASNCFISISPLSVARILSMFFTFL